MFTRRIGLGTVSQRVCLTGALVSAALAGCTCGSRGDGTDAGVDGTDTSVVEDAATAGPGDLLTSGPTGWVQITETLVVGNCPTAPIVENEVRSNAYAYFGVAFESPCDSPLVSTSAGACCAGRVTPGTGPSTGWEDYGDVTIDGLSVADVVLASSTGYLEDLLDAELFSDGQLVGFLIENMGAPIASSVPAPVMLDVSVPSTVPGSAITIDGSPIALSWTPAGADYFHIFIHELSSDFDQGVMNPEPDFVHCIVEDTGAFTIPAEVLTDFDFHPIALEMTRFNHTIVPVGPDRDVELRVGSSTLYSEVFPALCP